MKSAFVDHPRKTGEPWRTGKTGEVRRTGAPFPAGRGFRSFTAGMWLAGLFALLLICPLSASAHPPSAVQISYLEKEQALQVTISHSSFIPNSHYIKQVEIQKNAEKPIVYEYKSQPDKTKFAYVYALPLKEGDRVEVRVICNLYGSWTGGLVMAGPVAK
jgi:hypothetical protein